MNLWSWSRDHIYPIFAGHFVVGAILLGLTAVLTRSDVAIILMGVLMVMVGGVLSALVAERMGLDERAKRASKD